MGWQRFEVGRHHIDDYAGVTDPWAFLIEGRIRREGDVWQMALATPPVAMPPHGPPRYAIAMPLRPDETSTSTLGAPGDRYWYV